ncbi:lysylphosphatidylglycerol synthase transmembrane domain-containing protein [Candidatus Acidulodesulfobacterium sp. H_13]|uniref:lysylphosphatidylglycerol synthase transmembrane domain-containing protein n=1 Tax=Candidatus Acidulodesulfobacterium sp. H_13 TaxID=3395470 RepID=UPI003AF725CE
MNKAFIISTSIGLLFVIVLISLVGPGNILHMMDHLNLLDFLFLFFLSYLALFFSALSYNNALDVYDAKIDLKNLINIKLIGYSANYIAPSGIFAGFISGDAIMALILKKRSGFEFRKGFSAGLAAKVIEFGTFLIFIYLGLILGFRYFYLPPEIWFFLLIAAIFVGVITLVFLINPIIDNRFFTKILKYLTRFKILNIVILKILKHIDDFEKELHLFYMKGFRYLFLSLFLSLIETAVLIFQIWLLVHYLGVNMGFSKTLLIFSVSMLVFALPLAPGSAGTYELSQVGLFDILGLGSNLGLTFSLVMRAVNLLMVAISFFVVPYYGFHFFKKHKNEDGDNNGNESEKEAGDEGGPQV